MDSASSFGHVALCPSAGEVIRAAGDVLLGQLRRERYGAHRGVARQLEIGTYALPRCLRAAGHAMAVSNVHKDGYE
jgi:hypothetical protein